MCLSVHSASDQFDSLPVFLEQVFWQLVFLQLAFSFSSCSTSLCRRPMNRLIENTVLLGLVTCWCRAACPTRRSPLSVKPTTEGVVRFPVELMMTVGRSPSMTATTELVVPRSIPMILLLDSDMVVDLSDQVLVWMGGETHRAASVPGVTALESASPGSGTNRRSRLVGLPHPFSGT